MKNLNLLIAFLTLSFFNQLTYAIDTHLLKQAREQQQLAIKGDEDATEKAYDLFEQLLKANPNSAMLLANLGSLETIKGRDAWMPWNKMSFVESGLDKIDQALEMIEDEDYQDSKVSQIWQSIEARNVAANTFISLPSMFNRYESGKEELVLLLSSAKFASAPKGIKNSAYKLAIKVAKDDKRDDLVKQYQSMIEQ